jgi:hypothetical protein
MSLSISPPKRIETFDDWDGLFTQLGVSVRQFIRTDACKQTILIPTCADASPKDPTAEVALRVHELVAEAILKQDSFLSYSKGNPELKALLKKEVSSLLGQTYTAPIYSELAKKPGTASFQNVQRLARMSTKSS